MSYHRILPKPGSWDNESLQIDHAQTTTNPAEFQSKDGGIHKASIWESQVDFKSEGAFYYTFNNTGCTCRVDLQWSREDMIECSLGTVPPWNTER